MTVGIPFSAEAVKDGYSVQKNNLTKDLEQETIKKQRHLIFKMRQVLWSVIQWNDEYKHLNNISGDPSWMQTAYDVFMESRPQ